MLWVAFEAIEISYEGRFVEGNTRFIHLPEDTDKDVFPYSSTGLQTLRFITSSDRAFTANELKEDSKPTCSRSMVFFNGFLSRLPKFWSVGYFHSG